MFEIKFFREKNESNFKDKQQYFVGDTFKI